MKFITLLLLVTFAALASASHVAHKEDLDTAQTYYGGYGPVGHGIVGYARPSPLLYGRALAGPLIAGGAFLGFAAPVGLGYGLANLGYSPLAFGYGHHPGYGYGHGHGHY